MELNTVLSLLMLRDWDPYLVTSSCQRKQAHSFISTGKCGISLYALTKKKKKKADMFYLDLAGMIFFYLVTWTRLRKYQSEWDRQRLYSLGRPSILVSSTPLAHVSNLTNGTVTISVLTDLLTGTAWRETNSYLQAQAILLLFWLHWKELEMSYTCPFPLSIPLLSSINVINIVGLMTLFNWIRSHDSLGHYLKKVSLYKMTQSLKLLSGYMPSY